MISAYAIGSKVYLISTATIAEPDVPRTLPIGSPALTGSEALAFAAQITKAANEVIRRQEKAAGMPTRTYKIRDGVLDPSSVEES